MLGYRLIPEARMKEYGKPPQKIDRSPGHHKEWIDACKGGKPARANFDWAGPLTEVVLLGNVALKMERQLYEKGPQASLRRPEHAGDESAGGQQVHPGRISRRLDL